LRYRGRGRPDVPTAKGRAHQLYDARMPEQVIRPRGSAWDGTCRLRKRNARRCARMVAPSLARDPTLGYVARP
jgi:hypothetical protein